MKLPVVSWKQLVRFFESHGFERKRQKGSHISLKKPGVRRPLVIPAHKEVSVAIVLDALKTAGISRKDFILAMQKPKKEG